MLLSTCPNERPKLNGAELWRLTMTEIEFKLLAQEGYNRIPLVAEAFADL